MTGRPEPLAGQGGQPDQAEWEQASRAVWRESQVLVLSVESFEGPLDWLLEMARNRKIELRRLSIRALIDGFAEALEQALQQGGARRTASSLARWGDWLVMAATLTQLRARLMLPAVAPERQAATREVPGSRQQRLSHRHIQLAADWLERRPQLGQHVWARGRAEAQSVGLPTNAGDLAELLRGCLVALRLPDQAELLVLQPMRLWPVAEAMARVRDGLAMQPGGGELEVFLPEIGDARSDPLQHRAALASTLLAGLELAREERLTLEQADNWQPIRLRHTTKPDP